MSESLDAAKWLPAELMKLATYKANDRRVLSSVKRILESDGAKQQVKDEIRGAQGVVDLMQNALDTIGSDRTLHTVYSGWRRLLCNLSKNSGKVPTNLTLTSVQYDPAVAHSGGAYSDVFVGTYEGRKVCVKRLRIFKLGPEREIIRRDLCREAMTSRQMKHINLLPLIGILEETAPQGFSLSLVSPWMERGSLNKYQQNVRLTVHDTDNLLLQVAEAIAYLHSESTVHGDIKADNVLVDDAGRVQVADFGLTVFSDATGGLQSITASSARWTAPELLCPEDFGLDEYKRTRESDVFAFGMLCIEAYTIKHPFENTPSEGGVIFKIVRGNRPDRPYENDCNGRKLSDDLWTLARRCWEHQADKRPKIRDVCKALGQIVSS